jgi:hypothetical protein
MIKGNLLRREPVVMMVDFQSEGMADNRIRYPDQGEPSVDAAANRIITFICHLAGPDAHN